VTFGSFKPLDGTATVAALESGQVDVGVLFSTQSVIEAKDFVLLEDDMNLQAAESITPLISEGVVDDEVTQLLDDVSAALTTENITDLNGRVEIDQEDPATVAEDFLTEEGLL
ncbi:MAG: glycine/betaine ABC transporter substrate-binding protein, partial [Actinobacteria bacterium]|nr:glycine/betaine ABC transporter substrate-binding protein [Actinomycetota bacterium]